MKGYLQVFVGLTTFLVGFAYGKLIDKPDLKTEEDFYEEPCPAGRRPICPTPDTALSVFIPHDGDCQWFFHCSDGYPYCKECPPGLHFNSKLNVCDWPLTAGCNTSSLITTAMDSTSSHTVTTISNEVLTDASSIVTTSVLQPTAEDNKNLCPPGRLPVCPDPDSALSVFFPHDNDCRYYFLCSNGLAYCKVCPSGLHFNAVLNVCDWPLTAGCNGSSPITSVVQSSTAHANTVSISTRTSSEPINSTTSNISSVTPPFSSSNPEIAVQSCPNGNVPTCPIGDSISSVFFPHENDCQWFFHCSNGQAYCKSCPSGLHFNAELNVCDWPWASGCNAFSTTTTVLNSTTSNLTTSNSSETATNPTTPVTGMIPDSNVTILSTPEVSIEACPAGRSPICPDPDLELSVFYPHKKDCRWYYHCSNGNAYCKACPTGLYFNAELNVCDWPWASGCNASSTTTIAPNSTPSNVTTSNSSEMATNPASPVTNIPDSNTTLLSTPEVHEEVCPAGRSPICPDSNLEFSVYFPHDKDCRWYFHCSNGYANCKACPTGLYFNAELNVCDWPWASGCNASSSITTALNS